MDLQLQGKRALVTGSSSGIGETTAKALAKEGAAVVVHGRRESEVVRVAKAITAGVPPSPWVTWRQTREPGTLPRQRWQPLAASTSW